MGRSPYRGPVASFIPEGVVITNPALAELASCLEDQGVQAPAKRIASVLLGLARMKEWHRDNLAAPVAWLEQIAVEVLRASPLRDHAELTTECPGLVELQERLQLNEIDVDPRRLAAAALALACEHGWGYRATEMVSWLEQLAVDVAREEPSARC